jgi:C4-dicarboxylate-specific signal transduction histidine kinase
MNAFQAMTGKSNPCLTLRTSSVAGKVTLEVRDNGPGMAADSLGKLFDSFYTTKADGMGIGLAICRSLVEAHGGTIRAENGHSGGACFIVDLPSLS